MDAEKLNAVRHLQNAFPALTVSQARALLESTHWNLHAARAAAESDEQAHLAQDAEAGAEYFVGGAGRGGSAQQVLAQPRSSDAHDMVEQLFARAATSQRDAATAPPPGHTGEDDPQAFFGRGRRLGYTLQPSPFMAATLRQTRSIRIAAYRNGFCVDDGPLIPLESAEGREFAAALVQGHIPAPLAAANPDTDFTATLQDFLDRDYDGDVEHATGSGQDSFRGTGRRLTEPRDAAALDVDAGACFDPQRSFACDEAADDVTTVCLVTTAGTKVELRLNATRHTVEDLYLLAHRAEPALTSFVLVTRDRPPRRLEGESLRGSTIAAAQLKRAVVVVQKR